MDLISEVLKIIDKDISSAFFGAFFAFIFFVVGQLWISTSKKKEDLISELKRIKEYVVLQIYFLEINIRNCKNISELKPISILLNEFNFFPIENAIYQKIGNFEVTNSILRFIINLRILNEKIRELNDWIKILSDFSKVAMLENRQSEFIKTMTENIEKIKNETRILEKDLRDQKSKVGYLSAEIELTLKYVNSIFIVKWYLIIRSKISKEFRDIQIKKLVIEEVEVTLK